MTRPRPRRTPSSPLGLLLATLLSVVACTPTDRESTGNVAANGTPLAAEPESSDDLSATAGLPTTDPTAVLGDLRIIGPVIPAPPVGNRTSLYLTVANAGLTADTLLAIAAVHAGAGSIHRSVIVDGLARMEPAGPQPILPGDSLVLEPGGLHGMLSGLDPRPAAGGSLVVRLDFSQAGAVELAVPVVSYADLQGGAAESHR